MSALAQPRNSAFAVILRGSRVLLVRARHRRRWQLPGGRLKRREAPREAARREVDEETGLAARILTLTGMYRRANGSFAIVFTASVAADAEPVGPLNEICRQRWVSRKQALRLVARRLRRRLADAWAASTAARRARARARARVTVSVSA